jgi:hypothetical protein
MKPPRSNFLPEPTTAGAFCFLWPREIRCSLPSPVPSSWRLRLSKAFGETALMTAPRLRWIIGIGAFLLPTLVTVADHLLSMHLSGRWLYAALLAAVLVCGAIALTAPCAWWKRFALLGGTVCLLVVQVLALGTFLLGTTGLEGIQ